MKIWQKIYVTALILFLIMLNAGLFLSAGFIYQINLSTQQQQAETECFFLSQNFEHDFSILLKNGRYDSRSIKNVVQGYQDVYEEKNISILMENITEIADAAENDTKMFYSSDDIPRISVIRIIEGEEDTYRLIFNKELVEFAQLWRTLRYTFSLISFCTSLVLCLLLYILLKKLLAPLAQLNDGVKQIANGEYETRIVTTSSEKKNKMRQNFEQDEVRQLAENVNLMAEKISSQIDMLESENAQKQQLMDNMAHELRTPLTSIYGYAEYMSKAATSAEEEQEALDYIMSESKRLEKMGDLMLSMRMYQKEQQSLQVVPCKKVYAHVRELLHSVLEQKNIQLVGMMTIDFVQGEEILLINLFRNLIENAIHASHTNSKIFWNAFERDEKAVFEISDSGIGMDAEELKHIMEPFYRVDKSRSREHGGAGLGLAITRIIIEKLNGTINFDSVKGKGTKVTIILHLPDKTITEES